MAESPTDSDTNKKHQRTVGFDKVNDFTGK